MFNLFTKEEVSTMLLQKKEDLVLALLNARAEERTEESMHVASMEIAVALVTGSTPLIEWSTS